MRSALLVKVDSITESGITIPKGSSVEYAGHVIGGMIAVIWNGKREVIHPRNTNLRDL